MEQSEPMKKNHTVDDCTRTCSRGDTMMYKAFEVGTKMYELRGVEQWRSRKDYSPSLPGFRDLFWCDVKFVKEESDDRRLRLEVRLRSNDAVEIEISWSSQARRRWLTLEQQQKKTNCNRIRETKRTDRGANMCLEAQWRSTSLCCCYSRRRICIL